MEPIDKTGEPVNEEQFSCWAFLCDGSHFGAARYVTAREAVRIAEALYDSKAARIGVIQRIIITDRGDCICWEWTHAEGTVWPRNEDSLN